VPLRDAAQIRQQTAAIVDATPVVDMHTHLFAPEFGALARSGVDDLLTYHYLVAELMRAADIRPQQFRALRRPAQADLIWDTLFVRNTPISEAARGVVAVFTALGLNPGAPDLREARDHLQRVDPATHLDRVFSRAGVELVVMTNDPFDPQEAPLWRREGAARDRRFHPALRIDPLLSGADSVRAAMQADDITPRDGADASAARRFLDLWIERMRPLYMAVSLPDTFQWPAEGASGLLLRDAVLPACREHGLPFAMMIGVRRAVNPALGDAGDALGRADVTAVHRLCAEHPENRFLVTMLSLENQHELCVAARKFSNLMPFGCWWFLNNPSIVSEITRERLELLGPTFIPQHSDARILEQLLYKWPHARREIASALAEQYIRLLDDGRGVTPGEIERDVRRLFAGNFLAWAPGGR
jgi:hypothetical protein